MKGFLSADKPFYQKHLQALIESSRGLVPRRRIYTHDGDGRTYVV